MLKLALFLHLYQPPTQFPEVTRKITQQSYQKILKIAKTYQDAYLTLNMAASLTEQLAKLELSEIIDGFANLAKERRIEFTGSAAYHPLLPKLPPSEIERQVRLNSEINQKYFGDVWQPQGFFPPEMAYSPEVGEVVEKLGYKWTILAESGLEDPSPRAPDKVVYKKKNSNLAVFFRHRDPSLKIAFSGITSLRELLKYFDRESYNLQRDGYVILAMDGETFGHHQPRQGQFLEELLQVQSSKLKDTIKLVTISELLDLFPERVEVEPKTSTWGDGFGRWDDPKNPIHRLQWKLFNLALKVEARVTRAGEPQRRGPELVSRRKGSGADERQDLRTILDKALHSDQFWWASHSPCWQPKMVERGARMLKEAVLLSQASGKEKKEAESLYNSILATGQRLYGEEIIPC